jgi:hypothetical protein
MSVLPASPAARERELQARRRAAEQGYAQGRTYVDTLVGVASAAPSAGPEVDPFDIELLGELLYVGSVTIPVPHALSFQVRRDGPANSGWGVLRRAWQVHGGGGYLRGPHQQRRDLLSLRVQQAG